MTKYNIVPNSLIGTAFISESDTRQYNYPEGKFPKGSVVMEIDSDMEDMLIDNYDFPIVTSDFRDLILKKGVSELSFDPIDFLNIGLNLRANKPNYGFTKDSFWKLNIADGGKDFIKWKSHLVVSEKALHFLYETKAFADFDEGISLGPVSYTHLTLPTKA